MRVQSPILSVLLHHSGQLADQEQVQNIEVPPLTLPTVKIPVAIGAYGQGAIGAGPFAHSVQHSSLTSVANAGANQQTIFSLRPGLWEISVQANLVNIGTTTGNGAAAQLRFGGGSQVVNLIRLETAAPGHLTQDIRREFSLDRETDVIILVDANGVGETTRFWVSITANRML